MSAWQKAELISEFRYSPLAMCERKEFLQAQLEISKDQIERFFQSYLSNIRNLIARVSWQGKLCYVIPDSFCNSGIAPLFVVHCISLPQCHTLFIV